MPIDDDIDAAGTAAQIARGVVQRLSGDRLEPASYEIEFHDASGPDHEDWRVRRFHLSEGLSQCYEATIDLLTPNAGANTDELLGSAVTVHILRAPALERLVHGIVHRVDYIGISADNLLARVYVVPAFRLLAHRVDSRIFQDQSVAEILREVIEKGLSAFDRQVDWRGGLADDSHEDKYPKRDYCVQYGESDLDFASRIMEEEGIFYFFEHDAEDAGGVKEKLVLVDQMGDNPNAGCPQILIIDPDGAGEVPIVPDRPDTADTESIQFFDWCQPKQIPKVHARGFNWKIPDPTSPPEGEQTFEEEEDGGDGWKPELYLYGDRRKVVDKANDEGYDGADVEEWANKAIYRRDLFKRQTQRGQGRSNVTGLSVGHWFTLGDHTHDGVNEAREFLITRVIHTGDCPDVERQDTSAAESMGPRYENSFECIPRDTKFRPAIVTPRPRIYGPQTATVTGPDGWEIHTDKHGRIKVRFHWDRISKLDDTSSCWVRVAQSWSGPGWGTLFIPRIGMEVVCEFLEGNPDCPLVTGCVYNGRNGVPYTLPDEKTKSTIKSNSSVGGDGFNEFRFEDAKDAEEIFLHAQKDYNEVVLNDHSTHVGHDQSHNVEGDRQRTVKGNETITIDGNQNITIKGAPAHGDKGGDVKGKAVMIDGDYNLETTQTVYFKAPTHIKLEVGGSQVVVEPSKITLIAGGGASIVLDADIMAVSSAGSQMLMTGDINASANSGGSIDLMGFAKLASKAGSELKLTGDAILKANAGAQVALTSNAEVSGSGVALMSDSGEVVADGAGVGVSNGNITIKGSKVSIDGGGGKGEFAGIVKLM